MRSPNAAFYLVMQTDGNLVAYRSHEHKPHNAFWQTDTANKGIAPYRLAMQGDGNLVVYDGRNTPLWSSNTYQRGTPGHRLVIQDDRNIVLYDGQNQATWSSNTYSAEPLDTLYQGGYLQQGQQLRSKNGQYFLTLQLDGNLVAYTGPVFQHQFSFWSTNTAGRGRGPYKLHLDAWGNLILNAAFGEKTWETHTRNAKTLVIQDDRNVVLYDDRGGAVWASGTNIGMGAAPIVGAYPSPGMYGQPAAPGYGSPYPQASPSTGYGYVAPPTAYPNSTPAYGYAAPPTAAPYGMINPTRNPPPPGTVQVVAPTPFGISLGPTGISIGSTGFSGPVGVGHQVSRPPQVTHTEVHHIHHHGMDMSFPEHATHCFGMGDTLHTGKSIKSGEYINSKRSKAYLVLQKDGNLVAYDSLIFKKDHAYWSTNTAGNGHAPYRLDMQADGNLVIYDSRNTATWSSNTWNKGPSGHKLVVQDDMNIVVYDGRGNPTWSSNTYRA